MSRKQHYLIGLFWLTFIALAFFSDYSKSVPDQIYPKGTEINLIFSNPHGRLTTSQTSKIARTMDGIKKDSKALGLAHFISPDDTFITWYFQKAADQSVLVYQVTLQHSSDLKQIEQRSKISDINVKITKPTSKLRLATAKLSMAKLFILTGLWIITGLFFRSLTTPLIVSILCLITEYCSRFLAHTWSTLFHFKLAEVSGFLILFFSFLVLPIILISILKEFSNTIESDPSATRILARWKIIGFQTTFMSTTFMWMIPHVKSEILLNLSLCIPLIFLIWLIINTLLPLFTTYLGEITFWPGPAWIFEKENHSWHYLTNLAYRFPKLGFILIGAGIMTICIQSAHLAPKQTIRFETNPHLIREPQRIIKLNLLSSVKFRIPSQFREIDRLTMNLKKDSDVKSVTSVTQPLGKTWTKFNTKHRLKASIQQLQSTKTTLETIKAEIKESQGEISELTVGDLNSKLNLLQKDLDTNVLNIDQVLKQSENLNTTLNSTNESIQNQRSKISDPLMLEDTARIKDLLSKLKTNTINILTLKENAKIISLKQSSIQTDITVLNKTLVELSDGLNQLLTKVSSSLNRCQLSIEDLNELANANILDDIFIGQAALKDSSFYQSFKTYTTTQGKTTTFEIELKDQADAELYRNKLQKKVDDFINHTSLEKCDYTLSGSALQGLDSFKSAEFSVFPYVLISALLLGILCPNIGLLKTVVALLVAGLSTELSNVLLINLKVVENIEINLFTNILSILILTLLSILILSWPAPFYQHPLDQLKKAFEQTDQIINLSSMVVFTFSSGLFLTHDPLLASISLILGMTTLCYLILFPLLSVSFYRLICELNFNNPPTQSNYQKS